MSLSGPIVLVSDTANCELAALLRGRGNLLVNESSWALAPAAIKAGRPAALILDETRWDPDVVEPLKSAIASVREPYLPVLARASPLGGPVFGGALPIAASASPERVLARLNWVLRLRALHPRSSTTWRRARVPRRRSNQPIRTDLPAPQPCSSSDAAAIIDSLPPQPASARALSVR